MYQILAWSLKENPPTCSPIDTPIQTSGEIRDKLIRTLNLLIHQEGVKRKEICTRHLQEEVETFRRMKYAEYKDNLELDELHL